jgi:hypothetical protein
VDVWMDRVLRGLRLFTCKTTCDGLGRDLTGLTGGAVTIGQKTVRGESV